MTTCYAFDVDHTLSISAGPVPLEALEELRKQGQIVGICGNMDVFCSLPDWHKRISFLGQSFLPKELFLHGLKINIRADRFVMVGNDPATGFGASDDRAAAEAAGWEFITEYAFAAGQR